MKRKSIRNILLLFILTLTCGNLRAQDSNIFKGYLYNDTYKVYIQMDFYKQDIMIPDQEMFGNVPGFLGQQTDARKWIIVDAQVADDRVTAKLSIINDYGSEDLEAELKYNPDHTYTLTQLSGSAIKIVEKKKFVKIPKRLTFKKRI